MNARIGRVEFQSDKADDVVIAAWSTSRWPSTRWP